MLIQPLFMALTLVHVTPFMVTLLLTRQSHTFKVLIKEVIKILG